MDDNGVTLGSIQNILGHQSQRTTEIYLDRLGKTDRKGMEIYEQSREKSRTTPALALTKKKGSR